MDIKIIVATHKPYWMPDDSMYLPLHVGAEGKESLGYIPDNTGDNISCKNANYCELTGLYWAWKNLDADYIGVSHYRRYFTEKKTKNKRECIIKREALEKELATTDIILPIQRNYYIETNYKQYIHAHHEIDLEKTREILSRIYPEYIPAYDRSMQRTKGHRFNMFIMKKPLYDDYCEWLFTILFQLEKELDISDYNVNDARVFGFVSERLLDPWIETRKLKYKELPVVFMENEHWLKKGINFIKRKFIGKKEE